MDQLNNVVILPDPTQQLQTEAILKGWQVYAKMTSPHHVVSLQIWRPEQSSNDKVDTKGFRYKLVSEITYEPRQLRFNEVPLQESDDITPSQLKANRQLRRGDVIGLYFRDENPLPYSTVACSSSEQFVRVLSDVEEAPVVGSSHTFMTLTGSQPLCRHYSINAIFGE